MTAFWKKTFVLKKSFIYMNKEKLIALRERLMDMPTEDAQKELDALSEQDYKALIALNTQEGAKLLDRGRETLNSLRKNLEKAQ